MTNNLIDQVREAQAIYNGPGHNAKTDGARRMQAIAVQMAAHILATEERLRAAEALARVAETCANHRKDCHAYDKDMGHPPRDFDEEDLRLIEYSLQSALAAFNATEAGG
jgi:hypothetical protein